MGWDGALDVLGESLGRVGYRVPTVYPRVNW